MPRSVLGTGDTSSDQDRPSPVLPVLLIRAGQRDTCLGSGDMSPESDNAGHTGSPEEAPEAGGQEGASELEEEERVEEERGCIG